MDAFYDIAPPDTTIGSILKHTTGDKSDAEKQARMVVAGKKLVDAYTKASIY